MADLKTEGTFDRVKGRARAIWGDLTDDDFDKAQGNSENLIGRIKEKTGETTDDIRRARLSNGLGASQGPDQSDHEQVGSQCRSQCPADGSAYPAPGVGQPTHGESVPAPRR